MFMKLLVIVRILKIQLYEIHFDYRAKQRFIILQLRPTGLYLLFNSGKKKE